MKIAEKASEDERPLLSGCDASAGGMVVSVERILQQDGLVVVIDDPQSSIICRQHAECCAGERHARLGSAADSSMIANMNQALFLPTRTV